MRNKHARTAIERCTDAKLCINAQAQGTHKCGDNTDNLERNGNERRHTSMHYARIAAAAEAQQRTG